MLNKKTAGFMAIITILVISNVILSRQVLLMKGEVSALMKKTYTFENLLTENQKEEKLLFNRIEDKISTILTRQDDNKTEIQRALILINQKSDAQFSSTVSMSRTYEAILEEQKKRTVDTAEKDNAFLEEKAKAFALYKKENYTASYEEFRKLSDSLPEDTECRLHKVKSLFYINPADSSKYSEILENIKVLKQNGACDDECLEIEKSILTEKEGLDE